MTILDIMTKERLSPSVFIKDNLIDDPIRIQFFKNPEFCSRLKTYLSKTYNVNCQIVEDDEKQNEEISLHLKFSSDVKQSLKNAQEFFNTTFALIQTKTYNNVERDRKVTDWSTNMYSECVLQTIQKIMDNRKLFTVWDKSELFAGYYIVYYFQDNIQHFGASIKDIDQIIFEEISCVKITKQISNIKSKIFLHALDQLIHGIQKQHEEITILYCKQPQLTVCLFGHKQLVETSEKKVQELIHRNKLKTFFIDMNEDEYDYLLNECSEKLTDIEHQYKDHNVKLNVRQNTFQAPEYLVGKLKELIMQMIFDICTVMFERVETETSRSSTAKEESELKHLALINNYQIIKIETKSTAKIFSVPKAMTMTTNSRLSKFIIDQSIIFSSSESVFFKVSILNASIEIHITSSPITNQKVDITILSSTMDAEREGFDTNKGNSFVETHSGRKILFVHWIPPPYKNDVQIKSKFKKQIKNFISTSLRLITNNVKNYNFETVMFSTTEWEKCCNKKEFALEMINEVQLQLETRIGCRWRILFVFSKDVKQAELYQQFQSIILTRQNEKDGYISLSIPVITTEITLAMSRPSNRIKCQNMLNDYIKKTICITKELENQVDLKLWSQHMINAFYQYCITESVILSILLNNTEQTVELTGVADIVDKALDKYRIMTEIFKQKIVKVENSTTQPEPPKTSSRSTTKDKLAIYKEYFNIMLIYCKMDENICSRLKRRLIGEGYLVTICTSGDQTTIVKNCDLIIIYISEDYTASNVNQMKDVKSIGKKILLIKPTKLMCRGKTNWLRSMATLQLSYELFKKDFTIELDEKNFDHEYDRLLIEVLRYTKPGLVGQPYPKPRAIASENFSNEDNFVEPYFTNDRQLIRLFQLTIQEKEERKVMYDENLKILMDKHKIPSDQMEKLMETCTSMIKGTIQEEYGDSKSRIGTHAWWLMKLKYKESRYTDEERLLRQGYLDEFLFCMKCWQEKGINIIKQNIAPFTLTGDINDAPFPMPITNKKPWCNFDDLATTENGNIQFGSYENCICSDTAYIGSWFTLEESHDYYREFLDKDTLRRLRRLEELSKTPHHKEQQQQQSIVSKDGTRQTEIVLTTDNTAEDEYKKLEEHPDFVTKIKRGKVGWDITNDRLLKLSRKFDRNNHLAWYTCRRNELKMIKQINKNKGKDSDLIQQRQIGTKLKSKEKMDELIKLDDPNRVWPTSKKCTLEFLEQKKKNIIEFEQLCAAKEKT